MPDAPSPSRLPTTSRSQLRGAHTPAVVSGRAAVTPDSLGATASSSSPSATPGSHAPITPDPTALPGWATADGPNQAGKPRAVASGPRLVAVLALEPIVGFDMTIPPMVLGSARDEDGNPLYDVHICGLSGGAIASSNGFAVIPEHGPELLARADVVIIPGTRVPGPRRAGTLSPELDAALATIRPGTRIVSICTGAFVLAAAGLLDGRRATTHWQFADAFRALYPQVRLDENLLFVEDGDIWTSAGLAAGIDLCLHMIRTDHGSAAANGAARYCVVPPWREGGQSQFIERQVPESGTDGTAPTRRWALHHLDRELDLNTLAAHAHMSVRTFTRRFKAETGMAPGAWILQQRVRHARHLLETTDLTVDEVARSAGMGTSASLRHHMRLELGVPPLTYRKTFRTTSETLERAR